MFKRLLLPVLFLCISLPLLAQYPAYQSSFRIAGGADDTGDFIEVDAAGNIYVAGTFGAVCDFDPGPVNSTLSPLGSSDIYIAKYTPGYNLIWKYYIGGGSGETIRTMKLDASGNIFLAGDYYGTITVRSSGPVGQHTSVGGADAWLIKYDSTGNRLFSYSFGGPGSETIRSLAFAPNGDYYITGNFSSGIVDLNPGIGSNQFNNTTAGSSNSEVFLSKFSNNGIFKWARVFAGGNISAGRSVVVDDLSRVLVGGYFDGTITVDSAGTTSVSSPNGDVDALIVRYDSTGAYDNSWTFGGVGIDNLNFLATHNNEIITAGGFVSSIDLDPGTGTANFTGYGSNEMFISKLDANGNYMWGGNVGSSGNDEARGLITDVDGNAYLTGHFNGIGFFDFGSMSSQVISYGSWDGFVTKYSPSGNRIYSLPLGTVNSDYSTSIAFTGNHTFIVTGTYNDGNIRLDPTNPFTFLYNNDLYDAFIAQYNDSVLVYTGLQDIKNEEVSVYPNPANDVLNIEMKTKGIFDAEIFDMSGRNTGISATDFSNTAKLPLTSLDAGVYFVKIRNADNAGFTYKFVRQ